jgi:2-keto-4-pentenoate hydratase
MQKLGLQAPVVGHLLAGARLPDGATVDTRHWVKPVVEPEVSVTLARELDGSEDRAAVRAAIGTFAPALELADLAFPPEDIERIVAANIYQRHVVFGPAIAPGPAEGDALHPALSATVCHRGTRGGSSCEARLAVPVPLHALPGDPVDIVWHVARVLAAFGRRLRAGEVVITGSIVPPVFGVAGDEVRYTLDPAGSVSVTLG